MGRPRQDITERFWKYVRKLPGKDACWEWTGKINKKNGYGIFQVATDDYDERFSRYRQINIPPHRFSFELHFYSLNEFCALHRCDNRKCVRSTHLFRGTRIENQQDMKVKGRAARGERSWHAKLTEKQVKLLRKKYQSGRVSQHELADEYGITQPQVSLIVLRKNWGHVA